MREDELAVVPLLRLGLSSGTFDLAWLTRLGRAHAEGLRLLAQAWTEAYLARFEGPALASGADQRTAMELAARIAAHAGAGQVLVSQSVADAPPPEGVRFVEASEVRLKGFARPVRLLEACRA